MNFEIKSIYSKTDGCCHLCGKKHRLSDYAITWQREHHIPKAKGGSDNLGNLFVACVGCNQLKGTLSSKTVRRWMGLSRIPLSRSAKIKIREEESTNSWLLFFALIAFFLVLIGISQQNVEQQQIKGQS